MKPFEIVETPIEIQKYMDYVLHPSAGAVTVFTGNVREWTHGVRTLYLAYEAYVPMAEKKMAEIGAEMEEKWPGVKVAIVHRIGELHISDIAVLIAVSSPIGKRRMKRMNTRSTALRKLSQSGRRRFGKTGKSGSAHRKNIRSRGCRIDPSELFC